jgi:hypothetical protein
MAEEGLPAADALEGTAVFGTMAQVRFEGDTLFVSRFPRGWRVMAAGCTPVLDSPTTASCREADMRALFLAYLAVIVAGLAYFIVIGLVHR